MDAGKKAPAHHTSGTKHPTKKKIIPVDKPPSEYIIPLCMYGFCIRQRVLREVNTDTLVVEVVVVVVSTKRVSSEALR